MGGRERNADQSKRPNTVEMRHIAIKRQDGGDTGETDVTETKKRLSHI